MNLIRSSEHRARRAGCQGEPLTGFIALLLLVMLTGLPQIGIALTRMDQGGERFIRAPLTRLLLLDKLPPESLALAPPESSRLALHLIARKPPAPTHLQRHHVERPPNPTNWLERLTSMLYRHHSSYV
jgi:hypothetical protein